MTGLLAEGKVLSKTRYGQILSIFVNLIAFRRRDRSDCLGGSELGTSRPA